MATNPIYSAPPDSTVAAYLSAQPPVPASDHSNIAAVYSTTNSAPTQAGVPVTVPLALPAAVTDLVTSVLSDDAIDADDDSPVLTVLPNPPTTRRVVRLQIQNIWMPIVSNTALRVFLNRPDAHDGIPDENPHHVARVSFFCCGPMSGVSPCFVFDITRPMKRLKLKKLVKAGWTVQVLAVPLIPGAVVPTVVPGTVTITIAHV